MTDLQDIDAEIAVIRSIDEPVSSSASRNPLWVLHHAVEQFLKRYLTFSYLMGWRAILAAVDRLEEKGKLLVPQGATGYLRLVRSSYRP